MKYSSSSSSLHHHHLLLPPLVISTCPDMCSHHSHHLIYFSQWTQEATMTIPVLQMWNLGLSKLAYLAQAHTAGKNFILQAVRSQ